MNVFSYLKEDAKNITDRMHNVVDNYAVWPMDRVFEESKKGLNQIQIHFKKDMLLQQNLKDPEGIEDLLGEINNLRDSVEAAIDNLVMIHVDEPGFEQGLEYIAERFEEYVNLCKERLYPSIRQHLSSDDMRHINDQLSEITMS